MAREQLNLFGGGSEASLTALKAAVPEQRVVLPHVVDRKDRITKQSTVPESLSQYHTKLNGKSVHTVENYGTDVRMLGEMFPNIALCEFSVSDLRDFLRMLHDRGDDTNTVYRKMCAVKNFFRWLVDDGILVNDPSAALTYERHLPRLPEILTREESDAFLKASRGKPLHFVLTLLLLRAGLKRSELVALKPADIQISEGSQPKVRVETAKTERNRILSVPSEFAAAYLQYIGKEALTSDRKLFDYTEYGINKILKGIAARAGIEKVVSCQILRDTFGTLLLRSGEDMPDVLKTLGLSPGNEEAIDKYMRLVERLAKERPPRTPSTPPGTDRTTHNSEAGDLSVAA